MRLSPLRRALYGALGAVLVPAAGSAFPIFSEDFDGYSGDDAGIPLISEGADETWYGIRFQTPDSSCSPSSSLNCDIAVQGIGETGVNPTPVGRFEDEAGLVFHISTTGLTGVTLDFDWRLFSASGADNMKVGYFVGDIAPYASSSSLIATSSSSPYKWTNWVALTPSGGLQSNTTLHQTYALPDNEADVWVVFWLDNGEGDYGKIDNVVVTAVPEPGTLALLGLGLAVLGRRRTR
jgi:hypothetical protein